MAWRLAYGRLVATRVETIDGRSRLELTGSIRLPVDEVEAQRWASQLAVQVDLAIRRIAVGPAPKMREQVTGR
ncbi:hypothetical protein [Micromonospora nigra]|nr:hypothetical protein [Micromonospora nigra]